MLEKQGIMHKCCGDITFIEREKKIKHDFDHPNYPEDSAVFVFGNCEDF